MNYPIPVSEIRVELEYFEEVSGVYTRAKEYLLGYRWCGKISNAWLFTNTGYPLCIFLFEIENLQSPEDEMLWVIAGDFPSIYRDTRHVKSTKEVVETYIELAEQWIMTIETGGSLNDCYPFDVPVGEGVLELFKSKVRLLKTVMVDHIEDISVGGFN